MPDAATSVSLDVLNGLDRAAFVAALGDVFEHAPWVAERAWEARPFPSVDALHAAMLAAVRARPLEAQIAFLRAHPDLGGKAARAGAMTAASVAEQASAGLDRLTDEEYARFHRLNEAYRARFGFPFIIAVRAHDKTGILAAFERRLAHTREAEVDEALRQIGDITRLRLAAKLGA